MTMLGPEADQQADVCERNTELCMMMATWLQWIGIDGHGGAHCEEQRYPTGSA